MGCGLGWFVGPKFLLCDGLGWIGSVVWWVELKKLETRITLLSLKASLHEPTRLPVSSVRPNGPSDRLRTKRQCRRQRRVTRVSLTGRLDGPSGRIA